jgi:hypothetical protein
MVQRSAGVPALDYLLRLKSKAVLVVISTFFAVVSGLNIASAATGCYASSCTGKNPATMRCPGTTLDEYMDGSLRIELRYSRACDAGWARSSYTVGNAGSIENVVIEGWTSATGGTRKYAYSTQAFNGSYTEMIAFNWWVRACNGLISSEENENCTKRH